MRGFNKLPKVVEENEKTPNLEILDEPIKEYLNSKFYLPSTDLNDNFISHNVQRQEKSKIELVNFLSTNGRIFCNECNLRLRETADNKIYLPDEKSEPDQPNQIEDNKLASLKRSPSSANNSICSFHNPPIYQEACLTDPTYTISAQRKLDIHPQKSDRQM